MKKLNSEVHSEKMPTPPSSPSRRWGALRLATLVAGAQLVAFCLLLSRMPSLSTLSSTRRAASMTSSVASLRRCLPMSDRDSRFALPGECVTAQQRLEALSSLLRELTAALEGENIAYWLDSGALLGQFRAESLVIWDSHVNVGVLSSGMTVLQSGPGRLAVPAGYELNVAESALYTSGELGVHGDSAQARLVDTRYGFYVSVFALAESVGTWPSTDKGGEERSVKLLVSDPSVYWSRCVGCRLVPSDKKTGDKRRRGKRAVTKQLVLPEDWVLPLRSCSVNDLRVLCPARTELYLAHEFGENNF